MMQIPYVKVQYLESMMGPLKDERMLIQGTLKAHDMKHQLSYDFWNKRL